MPEFVSELLEKTFSDQISFRSISSKELLLYSPKQNQHRCVSLFAFMIPLGQERALNAVRLK